MECSLKGPTLFQAFGEKEKANSDDENAYGYGGAERPIIGGAEERLDNARDHGAAGAADEKRGEKVTEREDESEGGSGKKARHGERKNDAKKCGARIGAKVVRGFEERARDVLKRSIDGKKDERGVDVGEHEDDGERAIEKGGEWFVGDVEKLQRAVEDTVRAEDGFPRVAADKITDPERDDDELIEKFFAGAGVEGEEVSERVAEKKRKKSHGNSDAESAEENGGVERIGEELGVLAEIPVVEDDAVLG